MVGEKKFCYITCNNSVVQKKICYNPCNNIFGTFRRCYTVKKGSGRSETLFCNM